MNAHVTECIKHIYILPNKGTLPFSILDTPLGNPKKKITMASKKEEWGATIKSGASVLAAGAPLTVTQ